MAKILVTGGAGFIGTFVAKELIRQGHQVRLYDLGKSDLPGISESMTGSILDPYRTAAAVRGCDYVIHLAAALGVARTEANRLECLYINIQGTVNVLEACVKEKVKKIVFSSSSEVYGDQERVPTDELAPVNPKSNYAITKLVGEEYLRAYYENHGLRYAIVRFFNVYGPGQVAEFVAPKFVRMVMSGEAPQIYGTGEQVRSFCNVRDSAKGTVLALLTPFETNEIFNIGNDQEPISVKDLALKIIQLSGKSLTPQMVAMKNSDRSQQRDILKRIPSIEKAKRLLGFKPTITLEEGLKELILEHEKLPASWTHV